MHGQPTLTEPGAEDQGKRRRCDEGREPDGDRPGQSGVDREEVTNRRDKDHPDRQQRDDPAEHARSEDHQREHAGRVAPIPRAKHPRPDGDKENGWDEPKDQVDDPIRRRVDTDFVERAKTRQHEAVAH
jgi:hypothetical protein